MTPKCPACGAKFSHNSKTLLCNKCGIPDEIIAMGHRMVARWKAKNGVKAPVGGSVGRKKNKPGRKGVYALR